jgi:hypothetical protein
VKIGDIDPRGKMALCFEIIDQARTIAERVLEGTIRLFYQTNYEGG